MWFGADDDSVVDFAGGEKVIVKSYSTAEERKDVTFDTHTHTIPPMGTVQFASTKHTRRQGADVMTLRAAPEPGATIVSPRNLSSTTHGGKKHFYGSNYTGPVSPRANLHIRFDDRKQHIREARAQAYLNGVRQRSPRRSPRAAPTGFKPQKSPRAAQRSRSPRAAPKGSRGSGKPKYGMQMRDEAGGLVISAVAPGGAAARAGVSPGDCVVELGGHKVSAAADFVLAAAKVGGARTTINFLRGGRECQVEIQAL